ncbi:MAG: hypothetical protein ACN6I5_05215 [Hyphomicrobiales bacterium]
MLIHNASASVAGSVARMAGVAIDTTEPSMKPIDEARIAATSTNRRRWRGQKVRLGAAMSLAASAMARPVPPGRYAIGSAQAKKKAGLNAARPRSIV